MKTQIHKSWIIILPLVLILSAFSSCVNSDQYEQVKTDFRDVEYNQEFETFDSIYSEIPDYSKLCKTMNSLHAGFDKSILLEPLSVDLYQNSKETAIAFGMYIADLGYVRHYERVQLCMDYIGSVRTLAEKLAIGTKEFNETLPLIESSLGDKQVLFNVTDSLLNAGNIILSDSEKYGISALVLGGLWIESAYIGLSLAGDIESDELILVLDSHFEILEEINKLFACLDDESVLSEMKVLFSELQKKGPRNENLLNDILSIRNLYKK